MGIYAGTALAVVAAVGAGVSAYGTMQSAAAQSAEAKYQGQVAANNAKIAEQNRAYAVASGEAQGAKQSLLTGAQLGAIRAAEAANNVDVNTGSDVTVQKSERELGEFDTLTTMNNALLQAYGYSTQATGFEAQSRLDTAESGYDITGGELKATGGLLESASGTGFKLRPADASTPQPSPSAPSGNTEGFG